MADPPSIRAEALSSRAASVPDSSPPACPRLTSPSVGTYAGRVRTHARFRHRQPRLRMLLRRLLHRPIQLPDLLVQYPEQSQQVCPPAVRPRLNVNSRSILCPPGSTAWLFVASLVPRQRLLFVLHPAAYRHELAAMQNCAGAKPTAANPAAPARTPRSAETAPPPPHFRTERAAPSRL